MTKKQKTSPTRAELQHAQAEIKLREAEREITRLEAEHNLREQERLHQYQTEVLQKQWHEYTNKLVAEHEEKLQQQANMFLQQNRKRERTEQLRYQLGERMADVMFAQMSEPEKEAFKEQLKKVLRFLGFNPDEE
jgi:hypothetical protein